MNTSNEYALRLSRLGDESEAIAKKAIYEGAKVLADQISRGIDAIPNIHSYQKADLKKGLGIASMEDDGTGRWDTKIGFNGYGSVPTKKYPKGLPNILLARSVESGTSFRPKTPFVRRAVTAKRKAALSAMEETVDKEIRKIMEE